MLCNQTAHAYSVRAATLIIAAMIASSSSCRPGQRADTGGSGGATVQANQMKAGLQFDAHGQVVATAPDGSFVVQRGKTIDVFAPQATMPHSLPLGNPEATPGAWYAVSTGAKYLAFAQRAGWVELWDVVESRRIWKGDPGAAIRRRFEMPMAGSPPDVVASWGSPVFLDQRLLVTHHQRGIVVWDVSTGRTRCGVEEAGLTIARETFPLDAETVAVRCGTDNPNIANTSLFVVSIPQCAVINHMAPHNEGAIGALNAGTASISADRDTVRVQDAGDYLELNWKWEIDALAATADAQGIVWGTSEGSVHVWSRKTDRLASLSPVRAVPILALRLQDGWVHAIDAKGGVCAWPMPSPDQGESVQPRRVTEPERLWRQAMVTMGFGDVPGAAKLMAPLVDGASADAKQRFAALWSASVASREEANAFASRCRAKGLDHGSAQAQAAMLDVAADLLDAELVDLALDVYLSWLKSSPRNAASESRGVDLGISVAYMLGAAEEYDLRGKLLRMMAPQFPKHERLKEELKELEGVRE